MVLGRDATPLWCQRGRGTSAASPHTPRHRRTRLTGSGRQLCTTRAALERFVLPLDAGRPGGSPCHPRRRRRFQEALRRAHVHARPRTEWQAHRSVRTGGRQARPSPLRVVPPSRRWAHPADEPGRMAGSGRRPGRDDNHYSRIRERRSGSCPGVRFVRRTPYPAGSILADDGTNYQVKWDDADEEELVPRGGHRRSRRDEGFAAFPSSVRLPAVPRCLGRRAPRGGSPLLAESSVPLKVREIRERLAELGLRNETWARHGPRALAVLPQVAKMSSDGRRATLWPTPGVGDSLPELPSEAEPDPEPAPTPAPVSKPAPSPAKPIAAATPAEPAVPSAERLGRRPDERRAEPRRGRSPAHAPERVRG